MQGRLAQSNKIDVYTVKGGLEAPLQVALGGGCLRQSWYMIAIVTGWRPSGGKGMQHCQRTTASSVDLHNELGEYIIRVITDIADDSQRS